MCISKTEQRERRKSAITAFPYRTAIRAAPAIIPKLTGAAVAKAAAPPVDSEVEALVEEDGVELVSSEEELLVEALVEKDAVVLVVVTVMLPVAVLDTELLVAVGDEEPSLPIGELRSAGMEAAACCEVTAACCEVTAACCEVTGSGCPVTFPLASVWVKYLVAGLPIYSRGLVGCVLVAGCRFWALLLLTSALDSTAAVAWASLEFCAWTTAMADRAVKTMEKRILM